MLSEQIDSIVARRNSVSNAFTEKMKTAESWQTYVDGLVSFFNTKKEVWYQVLHDSNSLDQGLQLEEDVLKFKVQVDGLLGKNEDGTSLKAAHERANRGHVNLGIIGPWRIGKSQIIQQLTHLDTWLIPTDSGENCTACPINVINDTFNGQTNVAVISVFSVEEMCKNINGYIEYCNMQNLIPLLDAQTNDQFLNQCMSRLSNLQGIDPDGNQKGFFDKMKDYIQHASDYYKILSDNGVIILQNVDTPETKQTYRPYVSYYAVPGASSQSFKCLATKSVTLYMSFRFLDESIGKLRLLDTPGIGECKLNVSEGLSKALRYDLDIAVATALARPNCDDKHQIQDFHDILKKETTGRHPENWLYYMFNVYSTVPGMTSSVLKTKHQFIKQDLADRVRGGQGIVLSESHYADIDALINKGISCPTEDNIPLDTCRTENVNLSTFYSSILHEMVDSISQVDQVFYTSAEKRYSEVERAFYLLQEKIGRLCVVNYDNQIIKQVTTQMASLYDELKTLKLDLKLYHNSEEPNTSVDKTLSKKIKDYCSESGYGRALVAILGIQERIDNSKFDNLYNGIAKKLSTYITSDNWSENQDFDEYVKLKRKLIERIEEDILAQYDKEAAEKNLAAEKKKILDVYKGAGRLGEIVNGKDNEWHEVFLEVLLENKQYPDLLSVFQGFLNYELEIESELKRTVKSLRVKNQHRDQFIYDEDDSMPFDRYEKALKAFAFSLYNLEVAIKKALSGPGENSYESMINRQEHEFKVAMSPIKTVPWPDGGHGYTPAGQQLMMLYMEHSYIFKDVQGAAKNATATEWKRISKYNN